MEIEKANDEKLNKQAKKSGSKSKIILIFASLILLALTFLLRFILINNPQAAENYIRNIYTYITSPWRFLNNLFPFSITEVLIYILIIAVIIFTPISIYKLIRDSNRWKMLRRFLAGFFTALIVIASFLFFTFNFNFAFGYNRNSLASNIGYGSTIYEEEDLVEATMYVVQQLNEMSEKVNRNENLEFEPELEIDKFMRDAHLEYEHASEISSNEFLQEHLYMGPARAKKVLSSPIWSYTGIAGIFIPFWMESNVNISTTPDEIIFSTLHELAHSYGFARENEANFLSFYVGSMSDNIDIRYSSYLLTYTHLNNALYRSNYDVWESIYTSLDRAVIIDIQKRNAFWDQYEGPVQEVTDQSNDIYLKANQQASGIRSYSEVVNLIIAYYQKEIKNI